MLSRAKHRAHRLLVNAFCPTGPGGGHDNSCSPGGGKGDTLSGSTAKTERLAYHGTSAASASGMAKEGLKPGPGQAAGGDDAVYTTHTYIEAIEAGLTTTSRKQGGLTDEDKIAVVGFDPSAATRTVTGGNYGEGPGKWSLFDNGTGRPSTVHVYHAKKLNEFLRTKKEPPTHEELEKFRVHDSTASQVTNARKAKPPRRKFRNPLRIDPSRTATLRRNFMARIGQGYRRLKGELVKLMAEDAFGLDRKVAMSANAFCPTGPGGGQDNSCSPNDGKQVDSPTFKKWFGESKVVDAAGKPLPVYHATLNDFDEFKGHNDDPYANLDEMLGSHFAEDPSLTHSFIEERDTWSADYKPLGGFKRGAQIKQVYLKVENPRIAPQRIMPNGELEHDAYAIQRDIRETVMRHERALFQRWISKARNVTEEQGGEIFDRLSRGESIGEKEYNGVVGHDPKTSRSAAKGEHPVSSYFANYDSGLNQLSHADRSFVVSEYKRRLSEKGYDGISYENTAPMERGLSSQKCWIVFKGSQIKSATGNSGVFSSSSDNVTNAFCPTGEGGGDDAAWVVPTANNRFAFGSDAEKIAAFKAWLRTQLSSYVAGMTERQLWEAYIEQGFRKGAGRSFDDWRRLNPVASDEPLDFYRGGREEFMRSSFAAKETVEKVKLLAGRSFDELEDITSTMSNRIVRKLTDGLVEGKHPNAIARDMVTEVDISRARAETIARTEIIRAHAEGQLNAFEALGVEDIGVMVEWVTAGDDAVCELCATMEGVVLRVSEAHNLLPRHPRCRCAFVPANVGEDEKDQTRSKAAIEAAVRDSRELAGEDAEDWGPASISKERPEAMVRNVDPLELIESGLRAVVNAFCPTGPGGGVDPTCSPGGGIKLPSAPEFVSKQAGNVEANKQAVAEMRKLAAAGDLEALETHAGTPSPKVQAHKQELVHAVKQAKADADAKAKEDAKWPTKETVTVIKNLPGSTNPKLVQDQNGKLWVMKDGLGVVQLQNEADADAAYRALGIKTPDSKRVGTAKFSEYIEGGQTLSQWEAGKSASQIAAMHAEVSKGFVADAVLANWDSVGLTKDNILIKDGVPWRIDNGGALAYRAQGAPKNSAFSDDVKEFDTLRDASKNPSAAEVFKNVTDQQMASQLTHLLSKEKEILGSINSIETTATLKQRFASAKAKLAELNKAQSKAAEDAYQKDDKFSGDATEATAIAKFKLMTKGHIDKGLAHGGEYKGGKEINSAAAFNEHLKASTQVKAFTKLDFEKFAELNPNGIVNGTVYAHVAVPNPTSAKKLDALQKVLPPGTKILAVRLFQQSDAMKTVKAKVDEAASTQESFFDKAISGGKADKIAEEALGKTKLTQTQKDHIYSYTGSGYKSLNAAMRSCPPTFDCVTGSTKERMDSIRAAINNAPKLSEPIKVNRGISVHGSVQDKLIASLTKAAETKQPISLPSFTSTSTDYGFHGNVRFVIAATKGLWAKPLSSNSSEDEFILSPDAAFRVLKVEHNTIHMEQLK